MKTTETGTSLVEVLLALFLIGLGVLGVAPAFVTSMQQNASGADIGHVSAAATARLELLRAVPFYDLAVGGSLATNVVGYFDDSDPDITVRWEIVNGGGPAGVRTVRVRAVAPTRAIGQPKTLVLSMLRAL